MRNRVRTSTLDGFGLRDQRDRIYPALQASDGRTLDLDFTSGVLDSRITFTRASTATFINSSGFVTSASNNVARFDYNPSTLAPRGLLIEGQATNLLNWSETFATTGSGTLWNYNTYITRNATQVTGPDNLTSAYQFNETTDNQIHRISTSATGSAGAMSLSVWAKVISTGTPRRLYINAANFIGAGALFDLDPAVQTGSSGSAVAVSGGASNRAGTWVKYPNDWYRCVVVGTYVTNQTIYFQINRLSSTAATDDTFAGSTTNGLMLWGAQLETGSGASSYIPTGASQVTRSADVAYMDTTAVNSWFIKNNEATFQIRYSCDNSLSSGSNVFYLGQWSGGEYSYGYQHYTYAGSGGTISGNGKLVSSTSADNATYSNQSLPKVFNAAFSFSASASLIANSWNGNTPTQLAATSWPAWPGTTVRLGIGTNANAGTSSTAGFVRVLSLTYWPFRQPNATLQSLTQ